jgi:hypothetical protein
LGSAGRLVPYPENAPDEAKAPASVQAGLVMSGSTAHPDASWRWISYLSQHLPDGEHLQARRSLVERAVLWSGLGEPDAAALRYVLERLPVYPKKVPAQYEAYMAAVRAVVQGELTAAEALAALDAEVGLRGSPGAPAPVQTVIVTIVTATPAPAEGTPADEASGEATGE